MKWEGLVIKGELLCFERELGVSGFGLRRLRPDSNVTNNKQVVQFVIPTGHSFSHSIVTIQYT